MYIRIHVWRGSLKLRTDCDFTPWFQQTHLNGVACGTRFCSDLYVVFQQSTVSVWYLLTCSVFCLYRHFFPCVLFFYNDKLSRLGVGYILKWLIFCLFYVLPLVCCRCWDCTGCFILKIDQMHCAVWLPAWLDLICAVLHNCCLFALKKKKKGSVYILCGAGRGTASGMLLKHAMVESQALSKMSENSSSCWIEAGTRPRRILWNLAVSVYSQTCRAVWLIWVQ